MVRRGVLPVGCAQPWGSLGPTGLTGVCRLYCVTASVDEHLNYDINHQGNPPMSTVGDRTCVLENILAVRQC